MAGGRPKFPEGPGRWGRRRRMSRREVFAGPAPGFRDTSLACRWPCILLSYPSWLYRPPCSHRPTAGPPMLVDEREILPRNCKAFSHPWPLEHAPVTSMRCFEFLCDHHPGLPSRSALLVQTRITCHQALHLQTSAESSDLGFPVLRMKVREGEKEGEKQSCPAHRRSWGPPGQPCAFPPPIHGWRGLGHVEHRSGAPMVNGRCPNLLPSIPEAQKVRDSTTVPFHLPPVMQEVSTGRRATSHNVRVP